MAKTISTLFIHAPISKVWNALTDPDWVKQWQYGSELITDWQVGSSIRFRTEWEGQLFEQWGHVLAVEPLTLIQYSLFAPRPGLTDEPQNYFVMNYLLHQQNGGVKLEIIQEDNRPGAQPDDPQDENNPILKGLKTLLEC